MFIPLSGIWWNTPFDSCFILWYFDWIS